MFQLEILSGKSAGAKWAARRLPVRIGRVPDSDLQLEDPGVWDNHLEIKLDRSKGFWLEAKDGALVTVKDQPVQSALLRNGDQFRVGAAALRFWLTEARQKPLQLREGFVWLVVLGVCAVQLGLIYWLAQR